MQRSTKVIVTNRAALRKKHGPAGMKKIDTAITRLARADATRGITTKLIAIDRTADMNSIGRRVSRPNDARQAKRAIDQIYRAQRPEYLMILGAPDVVPHVRLENPMAASRDEDRRIDSDLPYACDAPYSTTIKAFLGPTRVLGRLPDVMGKGDTAHLVRLLDTARAWKSRPRSDYTDYFALSAEAWRSSTRTTTRWLFKRDSRVRLSPSEGPYWTGADLAGRLHLINCHGDTAVSEFYGESASDEEFQPTAHTAAHLSGLIPPATVVAAECCYGAELYEPVEHGPLGICQRYLAEGAWAFFGSTTISYGPPTGNNFADLLCRRFLRGVLDGASVGRAALEARQDYIKLGGYMEMIDQKTVAQFLLLGDPSIHPVQVGARSTRRSGAKAGRDASARRARRKRLARSGSRIGVTTAWVASRPDARPAGTVRRRLRKLVADRDEKAQTILSFRLHAPKEGVRASLGRRLVARKAVFHAIVLEHKRRGHTVAKGLAARKAARGRSRQDPQRLLVVREVGGRFQKVVEACRH